MRWHDMRWDEMRWDEMRWDRSIFFTRKSSNWSLPSSDTFLNWSVPVASCCFDCASFLYSRAILSWSFSAVAVESSWRKRALSPMLQASSKLFCSEKSPRCSNQHHIHKLRVGATGLSPNRMVHTVVLWDGSRRSCGEHQHLRRNRVVITNDWVPAT